ncbi:MAG: CAP domain-containing protein [Cyanobacteria bacterium P01_H01_bin.121]
MQDQLKTSPFQPLDKTLGNLLVFGQNPLPLMVKLGLLSSLCFFTFMPLALSEEQTSSDADLVEITRIESSVSGGGVPQLNVVPEYVWSPEQVAQLEADILDRVNQYRAARGLRPLRMDQRLIATAKTHSQAMASQQIPFGHYNFQQRVRSVNRQVRSRRVGENLAMIFSQDDPAERALQGWLRSSTHRQSLEDASYRLTGIGIAQNEQGAFYVTQIFVRPR